MRSKRAPRIRLPKATLVSPGMFAVGAINTTGKVDFDTPLAPSTVGERGERVIDLEAGAGTTEFNPGRIRLADRRGSGPRAQEAHHEH